MIAERLPRNLRRRAAAERVSRPDAGPCECSHPKSSHSMSTGECWFGPCGCSFYRPETTP